ncbi:titin-like [Scyliorhinus canicula]|uniref:titin-like n=1 Tax=Scyliorhinus canicula TaxID=7830 RepID=UPI0018F470E7|nr:titin-like [Scyliorhinus canicula]
MACGSDVEFLEKLEAERRQHEMERRKRRACENIPNAEPESGIAEVRSPYKLQLEEPVPVLPKYMDWDYLLKEDDELDADKSPGQRRIDELGAICRHQAKEKKKRELEREKQVIHLYHFDKEEPEAAGPGRRRKRPTVCKNYTDEQMAKYFLPTKARRPIPRQRVVSPVRKKKPDLYDAFPPARTPPPPKPWDLSCLQGPILNKPVPECGLQEPLRGRRYPRKPTRRMPIRPVRTPVRPPGPLSIPHPPGLPCPLKPEQVIAPFVIPPEYQQGPYLSQEARDRYNEKIGKENLGFDFSDFQTPEQGKQLTEFLDRQNAQEEMKRKQWIELKTLRNHHLVMIAQQQVEIQDMLESLKCPSMTEEEKAQISERLKMLEQLHLQVKEQLKEVVQNLLKFGQEGKRMRKAREKEEAETGLKPDTRRPGDDNLRGFKLLPPPPGKFKKAAKPDVCPLPFDRPTGPVPPPVSYTIPWYSPGEMDRIRMKKLSKMEDYCRVWPMPGDLPF